MVWTVNGLKLMTRVEVLLLFEAATSHNTRGNISLGTAKTCVVPRGLGPEASANEWRKYLDSSTGDMVSESQRSSRGVRERESSLLANQFAI